MGVKNLFPLTKLLYLGNNYFREFGEDTPSNQKATEAAGNPGVALEFMGAGEGG